MIAKRAWAWMSAGRARIAILGLALLTLSLAGCSVGAGSSTKSADQSLNALPWCDKPLISFQDGSNISQAPLTNWSAVKDQLGFTPYLPATLPAGSCLDLVGGSIHDPIFGGHLSITWVLPKVGPISFSEAPKHGSVSATPQCAQSIPTPQSTSPAKAGSATPTSTATPQSQAASEATTICIAALGDASVTIAAHLSTSALQAYFAKLQPNVDWQPTAPTPTATTTTTATATPAH